MGSHLGSLGVIFGSFLGHFWVIFGHFWAIFDLECHFFIFFYSFFLLDQLNMMWEGVSQGLEFLSQPKTPHFCHISVFWDSAPLGDISWSRDKVFGLFKN